MAGDEPTFWATWTEGSKEPELASSETAAVARAYEIALSSIGTTVHLMQMKSVGAVCYPAHPTATGMLARDPPRTVGG
jgi:hypothetical protein